MFRSGLAPPLVVLVLTIAWRFMVADKDKRLLRQSFALYLAPAVVGRMLASSRPPELGGEARTVTIYFSDVAGFSSFSEHMQPHEIVALMNDYLSAMTGIIEEHGGRRQVHRRCHRRGIRRAGGRSAPRRERGAGRTQPVRIYEALAEGPLPAARQADVDAYRGGLERWRAGAFAEAAAAFARAAARDPAAASFHARALYRAAHPPEAGWQPINDLDGK